MSLNSWKLPIVPKIRKVQDIDDVPDVAQYEEVIYDYNTMTYKTMSQQREINELKKQIQNDKEEKIRKLKNIIGYYYKRN